MPTEVLERRIANDGLEKKTLSFNKEKPKFQIRAFLPHYQNLKNRARRLTKNMFDAEDLTQETYLRALKNPEKFKLNSNSIAWLLKIMMNIYINNYNSKKTKPIHQDISPLEETLGRKDSKDFQLIFLTKQNILEVTKDDFSDEVYLALMSIPKCYRDALISQKAYGKSYEDTALLLNTPIGTTKSQINRGKKIFRRKYNLRKELQET